MSEIKMRDVKKNIFEKIKIEKVKELYFLCNYSNGSVVYIEKKYLEELIRFIETGIIGQLSDEVSFYLEECGFFDEAEKKIGQAYLHVTDRCNMNCIGCYSRTSLRNVRKDLEVFEIKTIMKQLRENDIFRVVISGGEPTLRNDLFEIVEFGKKLGFEMALISNGSSLISDEILQNLDYLSISLDVLNKKQNELNRVVNKECILRNIESAQKNNVYVNGIVTINATNIDKVKTYFGLKEEYNLPVTFSIFYSAEEDSAPFLINNEQLKRFVEDCVGSLSEVVEGLSAFDEIFCRENCAAGKANISVDASGNLSPCHMLHNMAVGNLLKDSEGAWERLRDFEKTICIPQECKKCDYHLFCGGGCLARRLLSNDGLNRKDPYCEMYKSYYKKQYKYIKEMVV